MKAALWYRRLPLMILLIGGSLVSCSKMEKQKAQEELSLYLHKTEVSCSHGSTFVEVTAPATWTLDFEESVSWARLSENSGSGDKADIQLSWDDHTGKSDRSCKIVLSDGIESRSVTFTQSGRGEAPIEPDPVCKWLEIPATDTEGLYFITHPMTIDDKECRNYSYYWDPESLLARWVAYPLNAGLLKGGSGRSEAWDYDPKIPVKYQPCLKKAYTDGYDRGHQIPSGDRQIEEYNKQTFYFTNMTPQNNKLNTGTWASLETYVRDRSRIVDTMYVVTGCVPGNLKVYDNDGKEVTVPEGYFKALLAYKKSGSIGITSKTGGYTAIGFYFKNASYSGSYLDASMTIDELEKKVGIDFYVNLIAVIGATKADMVESTKDNWWKQ